MLSQRQKILAAIREDLADEGFLEVETPLLVQGTCPDASIHSISVGEKYLVTSTEYQIKRLIAEGFKKVFTLTKNFRELDQGPFHSIEFTMLEWARAEASLECIEEDAIRFIQKAFNSLYSGQKSIFYRGSEIQILGTPWERLTVREAFYLYLKMQDLQDFSLTALCRSADAASVTLPENFRHDASLILSFLLDQLQKHLGRKTPTFLNDWPAVMTSSTKPLEKEPCLAQRSELYIAGIEISDGFPFLTEVGLQKLFFERELQNRRNHGLAYVKVDLDYLRALEMGMPSGAGMALGVDRLVMVLTGAEKISEVQAFSDADKS
jgi:lysyl-tRNA synthetase class 2